MPVIGETCTLSLRWESPGQKDIQRCSRLLLVKLQFTSDLFRDSGFNFDLDIGFYVDFQHLSFKIDSDFFRYVKNRRIEPGAALPSLGAALINLISN